MTAENGGSSNDVTINTSFCVLDSLAQSITEPSIASNVINWSFEFLGEVQIWATAFYNQK